MPIDSVFMASLAHELRNPLNGILGFTEFLLEEKPGPLNPRQKEYLGDVLGSGRLLLQLINDVADLSKIEAGELPLRVETFSLRAAMGEAVDEIAISAADKGIVLRQLVAPGLDTVTSDRGKLVRILGNLVSKAIKMTDSGEVCMRAWPDGNAFALEVTDSAVDAHGRGALFAEFQRLEPAEAQRVDATGLSLVLTKRLIGLLHGQLNVASRDGAGTTVTVTIG
jgi:signal transduction histidine kinase